MSLHGNNPIKTHGEYRVSPDQKLRMPSDVDGFEAGTEVEILEPEPGELHLKEIDDD